MPARSGRKTGLNTYLPGAVCQMRRRARYAKRSFRGERYTSEFHQGTAARTNGSRRHRRSMQVCAALMPADPDDLPPCAGCGNCCHLLVDLAPSDDVPPELIVEHNGLRCMDQRGDGACIALDPLSRLCTIYERRPQVCRDFKRAESLCRRAVFGRRGSLAPANV